MQLVAGCTTRVQFNQPALQPRKKLTVVASIAAGFVVELLNTTCHVRL
jgi:hypothetical protein